MLRSLIEKIGKFDPRRRAFPSRIPDPASFDKTVDFCIMDCLEPAERFITRQNPIITLGSCFAGNIARNLGASGYEIVEVPVKDRLFTPWSLRTFVDLLCNPNPPPGAMARHWGGEYDDQLAPIRATLERGATVIITFGLSTEWIDKETGEPILDPTVKLSNFQLMRPDNNRYMMRQMPVAGIVECISHIIAALHGVNPATKIVLTLSPIPLIYSGNDYPVTVADCISKSSLRVALEEVLGQRRPDVYYFPSFEILRWLAPVADVVWGAEDLISHVRQDWIAYVMAKFRQYYCADAEPPPLPPRLMTHPY